MIREEVWDWIPGPRRCLFSPLLLGCNVLASYCVISWWVTLQKHAAIKLAVKWVKSLSHVWLFVTPWTVASQAPPSMGFSRQEYLNGLPFLPPRDLPDPGIKPRSPALQADALLSEPPGKLEASRLLWKSPSPGLHIFFWDQRSENFFLKEPDSKYLWLWGPHSHWLIYSVWLQKDDSSSSCPLFPT